MKHLVKIVKTPLFDGEERRVQCLKLLSCGRGVYACAIVRSGEVVDVVTTEEVSADLLPELVDGVQIREELGERLFEILADIQEQQNRAKTLNLRLSVLLDQTAGRRAQDGSSKKAVAM